MLLVVVSLPRFTFKPPSKILVAVEDTLTLNCSASGDSQPVIRWKKQGGQLPVGRSQQRNGELVIRGFQQSDAGNYICVATSAEVFNIEAVTSIEVRRAIGMLLLKIVFNVNVNN